MHAHQHPTHSEDKTTATRPDAPASAKPPVGSKAAQHAAVLQLQRTHGNRAVQRHLQQDAAPGAATVQRFVVPEIPGLGMPGLGMPGPGTPAPTTAATPTKIEGPGGSVDVSGGGVTIEAAGPVNINASKVNANTAIHETSGIDKSQTVMTDTVIAATYTPGAGNIW